MKKVLFGLAAVLLAVLMLTGCEMFTDDEDNDNGGTTISGITLTADTWANGALTASNPEQWYKFTATAATQYIHIATGTLTDLYVQLCDSAGDTLGSAVNLYSSKTYTSLNVVSGSVYYIRVSPYSSSGSGTYKIAFTKSVVTPDTLAAIASAPTLAANTWVNGDITSSNTRQWYKFTATAATQYIHVTFGTLTDLYVQLYDSAGDTLGSAVNLYSSKTYTSLNVVNGSVYYLRVSPYSSSGSGTYKIAFTTSAATPSP